MSFLAWENYFWLKIKIENYSPFLPKINMDRITEDLDDALQTAAELGDANKVNLLLRRGANINSFRGNALRVAAGKGYLGLIDFLLQNGADLWWYNRMLIFCDVD